MAVNLEFIFAPFVIVASNTENRGTSFSASDPEGVLGVLFRIKRCQAWELFLNCVRYLFRYTTLRTVFSNCRHYEVIGDTGNQPGQLMGSFDIRDFDTVPARHPWGVAPVDVIGRCPFGWIPGNRYSVCFAREGNFYAVIRALDRMGDFLGLQGCPVVVFCQKHEIVCCTDGEICNLERIGDIGNDSPGFIASRLGANKKVIGFNHQMIPADGELPWPSTAAGHRRTCRLNILAVFNASH